MISSQLLFRMEVVPLLSNTKFFAKLITVLSASQRTNVPIVTSDIRLDRMVCVRKILANRQNASYASVNSNSAIYAKMATCSLQYTAVCAFQQHQIIPVLLITVPIVPHSLPAINATIDTNSPRTTHVCSSSVPKTVPIVSIKINVLFVNKTIS